LGWGECSNVWLAKDAKRNTFVAIKALKAIIKFKNNAYDQTEIL